MNVQYLEKLYIRIKSDQFDPIEKSFVFERLPTAKDICDVLDILEEDGKCSLFDSEKFLIDCVKTAAGDIASLVREDNFPYTSCYIHLRGGVYIRLESQKLYKNNHGHSRNCDWHKDWHACNCGGLSK